MGGATAAQQRLAAEGVEATEATSGAMEKQLATRLRAEGGPFREAEGLPELVLGSKEAPWARNAGRNSKGFSIEFGEDEPKNGGILRNHSQALENVFQDASTTRKAKRKVLYL